MSEYHKIQTVFKRDPETNYRTLLWGQYSLSEFEYLADNQWLWTEKVDGMNIRVVIDDPIVYSDSVPRFLGKTDKAVLPGDLTDALTAIFSPAQALLKELFDGPVCLYGEGYGGKIQKAGSTYGPEKRFILFDIKVGRWWLKRDDVEGIAKRIGLEVVPIVGIGTLGDMVSKVYMGLKSYWGNFPAEGLVARPSVELTARNGARIITKIKGKDFVPVKKEGAADGLR